MGFFGQLQTTVQLACWGIFFLSLALQVMSLATLASGLQMLAEGRLAQGFAVISSYGVNNSAQLQLGAVSLLLNWFVVPVLFFLDVACGCCCAARAPGSLAVERGGSSGGGGGGAAPGKAARGRASSVAAGKRQ
jgi:hypothetical protein